MRSKSAEKIKLTSYDDLFGINESNAQGQYTMVSLDKLHPFKNHPFRVLDDTKMQETVESIKKQGVIQPGIVRPCLDGYEVIAGHRRWRACELAGLNEMPVIIRDLDDDEATVLMVDTNIQRENLLPSEKAKAYSMKYEALKHQGRKGKGNSLEVVGEKAGESVKTVQRYIWLCRLSDDLLNMVDRKKLGLVQGVDLSFLKQQEQEWVLTVLRETDITISTSQSAKLRELSKKEDLTLPMVQLVLSGKKTSNRKFTLKADKISKYFPDNYSDQEIENIIYQLLEEWKNTQ